MTQDVVRYVKMRTVAARGLERYKIVDICGLTVVEFFYVRERSLYSIRSFLSASHVTTFGIHARALRPNGAA